MRLVSYVVPGYNVAPFIRRCIDSILSQTHKDIEVIVVDDGTKDNLDEVIASYGSGIKLIKTPNRGVSAARNLGFSRSSGDFVVFLDGDDFVETDHAKCLLNAIESTDACVAAYCNMNYVQEDGDGIKLMHKSDNSNRARNLRESLILSNIQLGCILFRREVVVLSGGFDPSFQCGEDWDFVLKASRFGEWTYVSNALTNYLVRPTSVSANYQKIYEQGRMVIEKHINTDHSRNFKKLHREWHRGFSMYVGHIVRQSIKDAGDQRTNAMLRALKFCMAHPRFFYYTLKRYGRQ